jgi:hypothetical protein
MPNIGFNEDIRPIFEPFADCMKNVDIGTAEGVFTVDLGDFATVKRLNQFILTAIRGYDPATRTAHPMPPGGTPLDDADIQKFAQWIDDGMPETRLIA